MESVDYSKEYAWKTTHLKLEGEKEGKKIVVYDGEVEVPEQWDDTTIRTACVQYLRVVEGVRETSFRQVFGRVVKTIANWGYMQGYFSSDASVDHGKKLYDILYNQKAAFNSPVWYNLGIQDKPQISACFILGIEDSMEAISDTQAVECRVYKGGSGAGVSYGKLRSSKEALSAGGMSSGPLPFIRGTDTYAKAIKSGGAHRRAAKMSILPIEHPDIEEFIWMKPREEEKARILVSAGLDSGIDGEAYRTVAYQDMNISVRLTDVFMEAVKAEEEIKLIGVKTKEVIKTINAKTLFNLLVSAIDRCGDPGVQFHDTINRWNTLSADGEIEASNPCGEFLSLPWTACNLASMNLLKYFSKNDEFDIDTFRADVDTIVRSQDILIDYASYPDKRIQDNAIVYRQLGLGYANLGALLSALNTPYDSDQGRSVAACITAIMTGQAYLTSAKMAEEIKPFSRFEQNKEAMLNVLRMHHSALETILPCRLQNKALDIWKEVLVQSAFRNAQVTLLAPTGTVSFLMGCATTGIEPEILLNKTKMFVDGRVETTLSPLAFQLLRDLRYPEVTQKQIMEDIKQTGHSEKIRQTHRSLFLTSLGDKDGNHALSYHAHIKMVAAVQPFLSMGISKTINLPATATIKDIEKAIWLCYDSGVKGAAIYKDKSKFVQPLTSGKIEKMAGSDRMKLMVPDTIPGIMHKFKVGNFKVRIQVGFDPVTRKVIEIYTPASKQGSTLSGWMDTWAVTFSKALQAGCPLQELTESLTSLRFEPSGFTSNPDIPQVTSIVDYIARYLQMECSDEMAEEVRKVQIEVEPKYTEALYASEEDEEDREDDDEEPQQASDAPPCGTCGEMMFRKGTNCYICTKCGSQEGVCG